MAMIKLRLKCDKKRLQEAYSQYQASRSKRSTSRNHKQGSIKNMRPSDSANDEDVIDADFEDVSNG